MKYAWIDAHRRHYPIPELCDALAVSISGWRAWKRGGTPGSERLTDPQALTLIRTIHAEFKAAYGSSACTLNFAAEGIVSGCAGCKR